MPIDTKKLAAMQGAVKPPAPEGRRFGIKGKPKEAKAEKDILEEADEEGLEDEVDEPNPAIVMPFLEQYADEIQACIDELDYDLLVDPEMELDQDNLAILQQGCLDLPPRLRRLLPNFIGIEYKDAGVMAAALVEQGKYDDAETLAGWIFRIGEALSRSPDDEEGEDLDEEEPE